MKRLKKILVITLVSVLVLIGIYFILCAVAPPFAVEKSTVINAKDSVIFAKFADFKAWDSWSPWTELDPDIPKNSTYTGEPYTKGHQVEWKSESQGNGRQVIEEIKPFSYIKTALYFQPNDEPGYSEFKLAPEGNGTRVTWSMKGKMPFYLRGALMMMGMNKILGKTFTRGLERMKADCEK